MRKDGELNGELGMRKPVTRGQQETDDIWQKTGDGY